VHFGASSGSTTPLSPFAQVAPTTNTPETHPDFAYLGIKSFSPAKPLKAFHKADEFAENE